jgi:hypothetical protein
MKPTFGNLYFVINNPVYQPVFFSNPARPESLVFMLQTLRLPYARIAVPGDIFQ